jgi:hypothetical protein
MLYSCAKETFANILSSGKRENFEGGRPVNYLATLLAILLWLAVLLLVAQYLWNGVLVKLVTVVKPATSIFQLLGLVVLLEILLPQ